MVTQKQISSLKIRKSRHCRVGEKTNGTYTRVWRNHLICHEADFWAFYKQYVYTKSIKIIIMYCILLLGVHTFPKSVLRDVFVLTYCAWIHYRLQISYTTQSRNVCKINYICAVRCVTVFYTVSRLWEDWLHSVPAERRVTGLSDPHASNLNMHMAFFTDEKRATNFHRNLVRSFSARACQLTDSEIHPRYYSLRAKKS
jgi:hypothetical protein